MQFTFKIPYVVEVDKQLGIAVMNGISLGKSIKQMKPEQVKNLSEIINRMGFASASAQSLKQVITTFQKFIGSDNRIYFKVDDNKVLGMLKVGLCNSEDIQIGNIKQMKPTCVLDFYVHESCQRNGIGRDIFEYFLKHENKSPDKLAYDRPSEKLLGFLRKYFGLSKFIPQNNNYVVFNAYFDNSYRQQPQISDVKELLKKDFRTKQFLKQKQSLLVNNTMNKTVENIESNTQFKNSRVNVSVKQSYELKSPWANSGTSGTNMFHFRTTSNSYGDHYRKR